MIYEHIAVLWLFFLPDKFLYRLHYSFVLLLVSIVYLLTFENESKPVNILFAVLYLSLLREIHRGIHRGASNENSQHIFCGEIRTILCGYPSLPPLEIYRITRKAHLELAKAGLNSGMVLFSSGLYNSIYWIYVPGIKKLIGHITDQNHEGVLFTMQNEHCLH